MVRFRLKCLRCGNCKEFLCRSDGQMCWKFGTQSSNRAYRICWLCNHRDNCTPRDNTVGNGNTVEPWNNAATVYGGKVNVNHDPLVKCLVCKNAGICWVDGKVCVLVLNRRKRWECMFCHHRLSCYATMIEPWFIKFSFFVFI